MSPSYLTRPGRPRIAYRAVAAADPSLPAVMFLPGFASDMDGAKASFLSESCARRGQGFIRFDYSGHGLSGGRFEDGTIGQWRDDALDVIDTLTAGRLILVGSSMGGWIGMLCALARPDRTGGFIGLAAAPDFTRWIMKEMSDKDRKTLAASGVYRPPGAPDFYYFTQKLLDEGEAHSLMDGPVKITAPVRLVQGRLDDDVPWRTAEKIHKLLASSDSRVHIQDEGDHRLSAQGDLDLLDSLVMELSEKKD